MANYKILCKREENTFVFECPWCGKKHIHGAKEGWRSSHCNHADAPKEYFIKEHVEA
jgi:predicted RNA-binding Zn-ribbon protein involved in translation (DUF1610 family)